MVLALLSTAILIAPLVTNRANETAPGTPTGTAARPGWSHTLSGPPSQVFVFGRTRAATPAPPSPLSALLTGLAAAGGELTGAQTITLATWHRGQVTGEGLDTPFVSASAAKLYWVVAAVDLAGLEAVAPYAEAIFAWSDNEAAGSVIDLAGVDAVNRFLADRAGLENTALVAWDYGVVRESTEFPGPFAGDNYTTVRDAVTFLARLKTGALLPPAETAALLGWLGLSPRNREGPDPLAGLLGDQLPTETQAAVLHKAGWLPPGCCDDGQSVLVDVGIVPLADGDWYAVALSVADASDFDAAATFVSWASCEIFASLSPAPPGACSPVPGET